MFKPIEGEAAILVERGVYKQVDLYERDGYIYAKLGGGFVRLNADGSTSKPHMRLEHMSWDRGALMQDTFGRLCRVSVAGSRELPAPRRQMLLGAPDGP